MGWWMGNGRWASALGAIVAIALLGVAPAHAEVITSCGKTITENSTLGQDIQCSSAQDGVKIGADGITFDLAGHTMTGGGGSGLGVRNDAGHSGVKIRHGTIENFLDGLFIKANGQNTPDDAVLLNLRVQDNHGRGIYLINAKHATVLDTFVLRNNSRGIEGDDVDKLVLGGNTIKENDGDAIRMNGAAPSIRGNTIVDNATGVTIESDESVAAPTDGGVIADNFMSNNSGGGIYLTGMAGPGTKVADNRICWSNYGITLVRDPVSNASPDGVTLTRNSICGSATYGINLLDAVGTTTISHNVVRASLQHGIRVDGGTHTNLVGNLSRDNRGDGFLILINSNITLTANTALSNLGVGIKTGGVTDGGKNRARFNVGGNCQGLSC